VIANLTAGNKIKFQYVDRNQEFNHWPDAHVKYAIDSYEGTVIDIRDTEEKQISLKTAIRKPSVERSRYLLVVQLSDNKIKSFYDGRVINLEEIKEVPKSFLKRTLDKLRGK